MTVSVIGLDLSLTSTGLAFANGTGYDTHPLKPPRGKDRGHDRLAWFLREVEAVADRQPDLVVVEGPAYGSSRQSQRGHHERAGLWWMVVHALWQRTQRVAIAPPQAVKRYATGKGNASKDLVLAAVVRRFPDFAGGNDEADALILAALGTDHLGHPIADMPATHRTALTSVEWPEVNQP